MSKTDIIQSEQDRHREAFELYHSLGESRNCRTVADRLNVSVSAVKLWSRSFGWNRRARERDVALARKIADSTLDTGRQERNRYRKIVELALVRLARGIADGKVRMQMGDLDRLIRLKAFMEGYEENKPDEITVQSVIDYVECIPSPILERAIAELDKQTDSDVQAKQTVVAPTDPSDPDSDPTEAKSDP